MIDLLATDDCLEVMREARNSHWVSKLQRVYVYPTIDNIRPYGYETTKCHWFHPSFVPLMVDCYWDHLRNKQKLHKDILRDILDSEKLKILYNRCKLLKETLKSCAWMKLYINWVYQYIQTCSNKDFSECLAGGKFCKFSE